MEGKWVLVACFELLVVTVPYAVYLVLVLIFYLCSVLLECFN
jgi:hypothetical protein